MLRFYLTVLMVVGGACSEPSEPHVHTHPGKNDSMQASGAVDANVGLVVPASGGIDVDPSSWATTDNVHGESPAVVQSDLAPGLCIHAEQGLVVGSLMKLAPCDDRSTQFKWSRDTQQITLLSHPNLCVDLTSSSGNVAELMKDDDISPENTLLQLQPCDSDVAHQKWLIGTSMKSKARPDLCISPDERALANNVTSTPLEVSYCKSIEKSQGFRYIAVDDHAELLEKTQEIAEAKERLNKEHSDHHSKVVTSHSAEVGTTGKLHMKHARKSSTDAKILNLDLSDGKIADHKEDSTLMRRGGDAEHASPPQEHVSETLHVDQRDVQTDAQKHAPKSDVDVLLERISEGLIEDEDDEEELSAADLDAMLDRAVVAKRRRPPPPPPVPPKINCQWGKWGKWGSCTADCGGGTKDRSRGEKVPAENGGLQCDGEAEEEKECNKQPCTPPAPPPTTPPAATTPPPMMAKGGAERLVSLTPAVMLLTLLANYQSLM